MCAIGTSEHMGEDSAKPVVFQKWSVCNQCHLQSPITRGDQVSIGDVLMCGVATATAVYLPALPKPPELRILRNAEVLDDEDKYLVAIQQQLMQRNILNRKTLQKAAELALAQGDLDFADSAAAARLIQVRCRIG